MASALNGVKGIVFDQPTDQVTGTWSTDGTVDASYPLTNIDTIYPWKPVKFTVNPSFLLIDFGSAKRVDVVSFIHCNFDTATIHVQMNATNAWGAPTVDRTVTVPAATEDGMPANPWVDMTADPGYSTSGLRWLRITTANTALLSLGLVRLTKTLRQLTATLRPGTRAEDLGLPVMEFNTYGSVQLGYRIGVRLRPVAGEFLAIATNDALIKSWFLSTGRYFPHLLILDPSVNEAMWMKWGSDPTWRLQRTYAAPGGVRTVAAAWDEYGRGMKP